MNIQGKHYRSIWVHPENDKIVQIIEQRKLPFQFVIDDLKTVEDAAIAIEEMRVRGAPLIGITAAYGIYLAVLEAAEKDNFDAFLEQSANRLKATRPTAVNLEWAIEQQLESINSVSTIDEKIKIALETANQLADQDAEQNKKIGEHGLPLIEEISRRKGGKTVNILTHCNAGWIACVDYGTATSPIYQAFDKGIDIHVWVDETRPRNQGARLTAWELGEHGIPHTVIIDNTGGHLMQHGMVDMVIVGTDRTTYTGDVANKIGTYLKALAAKDNDIPFYVALPSSTIDWKIRNGVAEIPIEERNANEVSHIEGWVDGEIKQVRLTPESSNVANYGFDVTPARLVTGLITERGICEANEKSILSLFPERVVRIY